MLYQQLRILAFVAMALVRPATAATFNCVDNGPSNRGVYCEVLVGSPGNTFGIFENQGWSSTTDHEYWAEITAVWDNEWDFAVENNGVSCTGSCTPFGGSNCGNGHQQCPPRCWQDIC